MRICHILPLSLVMVVFLSVSAPSSSAQEPEEMTFSEQVSLFDSMDLPSQTTHPSSQNLSPKTPAELRQARALYRSQQRIARQEYNLWMGREPLRPSWNAIPMTSSRYAPRHTYYIPVYIQK
ncbi:hypothetical protein [Novipirellula rosea]|uniref:Uncharacterized protein n=1 Tax=Novipirellula rosea TaxID=1031540 RepID=A0ABP8N333_9BACT|tara:strand:- start:2548 stop:2913 length:366 start_codon:yes stop_codon:yes gene_type:complete